MDEREFRDLVAKYKQEMIDMSKLSTNPGIIEKDIPAINNQSQSKTVIEGEKLFPIPEDIESQILNSEVPPSNDDQINQSQEYMAFLKKNPKQGELKIQAFTARQTYPVADVAVEISKTFDGFKKIFYSLITDQNGIIDGILLPAPDREMSQQPSDEQPFATYNIRAEHPGYIKENYINIPIFANVKSIQPINLKPIVNTNS